MTLLCNIFPLPNNLLIFLRQIFPLSNFTTFVPIFLSFHLHSIFLRLRGSLSTNRFSKKGGLKLLLPKIDLKRSTFSIEKKINELVEIIFQYIPKLEQLTRDMLQMKHDWVFRSVRKNCILCPQPLNREQTNASRINHYISYILNQ